MSIEIPLQYRTAVDTYQPVNFEGIMLYPIKVRDYEAFGNARPAIDFLQQSLPVRYLSMPLLSAFYAMDVENNQQGKEPDGYFLRAMLFLVLSLRFRPELPVKDRLHEFLSGVYSSTDNPTVLKRIEFQQDGETKEITPILFSRMRPVLAAQNGIELISTDANPELIEAERDLAELNGPEIDYNLQALLSFVAALSHAEESEIYNWPILKLNRRRDSYERVLQFLLCGLASANGAQFKGGNPVPSPIFARKEQASNALIDMAAFTKGQKVSVSENGPPTF